MEITHSPIEFSEKRMKEAWNQKEIPIILRRDGKGEKLRIRLPADYCYEHWLHCVRPNGRKPVWFGEEKKNYWEVPKSWFNDFVNRALEKFGKLFVIQPYNVQEKCAPACQKATGHECQCSCMGANHGIENDGSWFEVSEAFASRWEGRQLACRLMVTKSK